MEVIREERRSVPERISPPRESPSGEAHAEAPKQKGRPAGPPLHTTRGAGLHPVLGAEIAEVFVEMLPLQPLRELRLHFVERRDLGVTDIVELDHVPAE